MSTLRFDELDAKTKGGMIKRIGIHHFRCANFYVCKTCSACSVLALEIGGSKYQSRKAQFYFHHSQAKKSQCDGKMQIFVEALSSRSTESSRHNALYILPGYDHQVQ
jgi:hypothetical protein